MNEDIDNIKSCRSLLVPADKSRNIYKVEKSKYEKLMHDNITKTYKKDENNKMDNINKEAKVIATSLEIKDRVAKLGINEAYVTVKDHKDDFPNKFHVDL